MKPNFGGNTKDNSRRKFPGVGGRRNNPVGLETKRKEALERNAKWASLSLREQLANLDRRFPDGATRQKERLKARLREESGRTDGRPQAQNSNQPAQPGKLKAKDRREQERAQSRAGK